MIHRVIYIPSIYFFNFSTALSKRQAAEKAAIQALHWLYANRRIDDKGHPIFEKTVIDELNSSLQEPIKASISDACIARIEKIWDDYDSQISEYNDVLVQK